MAIKMEDITSPYLKSKGGCHLFLSTPIGVDCSAVFDGEKWTIFGCDGTETVSTVGKSRLQIECKLRAMIRYALEKELAEVIAQS